MRKLPKTASAINLMRRQSNAARRGSDRGPADLPDHTSDSSRRLNRTTTLEKIGSPEQEQLPDPDHDQSPSEAKASAFPSVTVLDFLRLPLCYGTCPGSLPGITFWECVTKGGFWGGGMACSIVLGMLVSKEHAQRSSDGLPILAKSICAPSAFCSAEANFSTLSLECLRWGQLEKGAPSWGGLASYL